MRITRHNELYTWVGISGVHKYFSTLESVRSFALLYGGFGIYPPIYQ